MKASEALAMGVEQHRAGRLHEAEQLYRQALTADPDCIDARCNLGVLYARAGRHAEAVAEYVAAIRLHPGHLAAYANLGNLLYRAGHLQEAAARYQTAAQLDGSDGRIWYQLGRALFGLEKLEAATAAFQEAVAQGLEEVELWNYLGEALRRRGRLSEAEESFREALRRAPNEVRARNNLGLALAAQGRLEEAALTLKTAVQIRPDYSVGYNGLGCVLSQQGQGDAAWSCFQEAVRLNPDFAEAHSNLGESFREQGYLDEAIGCLREAVARRPEFVAAHSNLLLTLNYPPGSEASTLLAEHRRWAARHADTHYPAAPLSGSEPDSDPCRRLRIGYVSADFRAHSCAALIEPLLAAHDREQFNVACFANVAQPDALTERMQAHANEWHPIAHQPDEAVARLIREQRIDLLIDLSGHTAGNRLLVFARRPAPIQLTALGYPNTTGLTTIDYRLTDAHMDPPGMTESHYTEQLLRLPETACCYQPPLSAPPVGRLPADERGWVTFGSFNGLAKVTDETLALWARVLAAIPRSRLLVACAAGRGSERVQSVLTRGGIHPDRLRCVPRQHPAEYLQLYGEVDLGLDPFPYTGGITTADALWMGVPVITLAGEACRARQSASILTNVGLLDFIAADQEAYVATAARWAGDLTSLRQVRAKLRDQMRESPLLDPQRYARHVEAAYRHVWAVWCASSSR